jgi:hypothetical protein
MSAAELGWRIGYRAFLSAERVRHARGRLLPANRLRKALRTDGNDADAIDRILECRSRVRTSFFPGVDHLEEMRHLFDTRYAAEAQSVRHEAAAVLRHEFQFFGQRFTYGAQIDWHADPPSGRPWPRTYHRHVPVNGGDAGAGDVKYVWELNRHQFLMDLGKARFLFDHTDAGNELVRLVRHWRSENPYGTGVSWACALEPAFRVWSWLWSYHLLLPTGALGADDHWSWLAGFYEHGHFLHRHLEYYSSPYNHLVGEAAALYALGVLFPEFREAGAWRRRGRWVLESRLATQFHADGGSVEQSTFYHHATLGFYILAAVLGRLNGEEFAPAVWASIERGIEFSMTMAQPDGLTPRIGGADDGKPIRLQHLPFWDFRPYYAMGAVLFSRSDFKFAAGRFFEDALWLLGPQGLRDFERLPAEAPSEIATPFRHSGYFVMRSDWSPEADYVCFDCGDQAAGARRDSIRSALHGHADCLSVVVWLGGQPVLVDPGFFCYNGEPAWEVHFRRTCAHNTARIDGCDQATHVSKMDWCRTFEPHFEQWQINDVQALVAGSHDGYVAAHGITHRRTVVLRSGGYVVLLDEFDGAGTHEVELTYQFAPGEARLENGRLLFGNAIELVWHAPPDATARLRHGGTGPEDGWIAPSLGVRVPAPRLDLRLQFTAPRTVVCSVLADLKNSAGGRRVRRVSEPIDGEIFTVEGREFADSISAQPPAGDTLSGSAGLVIRRIPACAKSRDMSRR